MEDGDRKDNVEEAAEEAEDEKEGGEEVHLDSLGPSFFNRTPSLSFSRSVLSSLVP